MIIYIFGNDLLDFDNTPLKLAPMLKKEFPKIDFVIMDPNENIHPVNKELIIIDTIMDIDNVIIFEDLNKIQLNKTLTMHDFDLGFNLKLLQKLGQLEKVTIFGVPPNIKKQQALEQLIVLIKQKFSV